MKKIFGVVIASMMFANIGFAEIKMIESEIIGAARVERYQLSTVCVDGYKFVVAKSGEVHSMSISFCTLRFELSYVVLNHVPIQISYPSL